MQLFISNTKINYIQSAVLIDFKFLVKKSQIVTKMDFLYV
jgi:hypothetical protein